MTPLARSLLTLPIIRMSLIICATAVIFSVQTNAHQEKYFASFPLAAHTVIRIVSFDIDTETFCVSPLERGNAFVTVAGLISAVPSLSIDKVLGNPTALYGEQFTTEKEIETVTGDTVEANHSGCTPG